MCDFAGTEVVFWSGPGSRDFVRDHSSHTRRAAIFEFPSARSVTWVFPPIHIFDSLEFLSWPTFIGHHQLTKNQNTQTTARSFYLMMHLIWWLLPGNWWCLGLPCQRSVSALLLGRGSRARVIVLRWQEVIVIAIRRRKVIALAEDKTFSKRNAWPSIWDSLGKFLDSRISNHKYPIA